MASKKWSTTDSLCAVLFVALATVGSITLTVLRTGHILIQQGQTYMGLVYPAVATRDCGSINGGATYYPWDDCQLMLNARQGLWEILFFVFPISLVVPIAIAIGTRKNKRNRAQRAAAAAAAQKLLNQRIALGMYSNRQGIPTPHRPLTDKEKRIVHNSSGGKCQHCGTTFNLQYDHIVPRSKGGANEVVNRQLLCGQCNRRKGNRHSH